MTQGTQGEGGGDTKAVQGPHATPHPYRCGKSYCAEVRSCYVTLGKSGKSGESTQDGCPAWYMRRRRPWSRDSATSSCWPAQVPSCAARDSSDSEPLHLPNT